MEGRRVCRSVDMKVEVGEDRKKGKRIMQKRRRTGRVGGRRMKKGKREEGESVGGRKKDWKGKKEEARETRTTGTNPVEGETLNQKSISY